MEDLVFMLIVFTALAVGFVSSILILFLVSAEFRNDFLNDFWRN